MRVALAIAACALGALGLPAFGSAAAPVVSDEYPVSTPILMSDPGSQESAVGVWNPTQGKYLVLWIDDTVIRAQWMSPAGVLDPGSYAFTITPSARPSRLAIAATGTFALLAWDQQGGSGEQGGAIWAIRILDDLVPIGTPFLISNAPESNPSGPAIQRNPAVTTNGGNFLVAWEDGRRNETDAAHSNNDGTDIYAARVSGNVFASDLVLDDAGIQLTAGSLRDADGCGGADPCDSCAPQDQCRVSSAYQDAAAASDGTSYMVAWAGVQARPVTSAGAPGTTVTVGSGSTPDLIWNPAASVYFSVWRDAGTDDIKGARLAADGAVLDSTPTDIVTTAGDRRNPKAIALSANAYYVAWGEPGSSGLDLYGARPLRLPDLSGRFVWLEGAPQVVAAETGNQQRPALAAGGTYPLVAWTDARTDGDVFAGRIDSSGARLDGSGLLISRAANRQLDPRVLWNGSANLVLWNDRRAAPLSDLYRGRLSPAGAILDGPGSLAASNGAGGDIASDGNGFLAVWASTSQVYAARLDASGAMVGSELSVAGPVFDRSVAVPSVAWNGANYLVAWRHYGPNNEQGVLAARVNTAGVVLDASPAAVRSGGNGIGATDVASDGGNWLVTWIEATEVGNQLFARRLDRAASPLGSRFAVSDAGAQATLPRVAWDGDRYLVVWQDGRNSLYGVTNDIYGARVDEGGTLLDTTAIPIAVASGMGGREPAVAFNGARFVVAWRGYDNDVRAARVAGTGAVLDGGGVAITGGGNALSPPALTPAAPGRITVAYARNAPEPQYGDVSRVFVRFFDDDVTPTPDTAPPSNPTSFSSPSHSVGVASADNTIDVVWSGAVDSGRGVGGFSYVWDTSPSTLPESAKNADAEASSATSPPLADGAAHYFHLRTMDKAGNWAAFAIHLGPFSVATPPPAPPAPLPPPPGGSALPSLTIADAKVKEGDRGTKAMRFRVRLSAASAQPVTVRARTQNGTAKPRQDFVGRSVLLTFQPGTVELVFVVKIKGDTRREKLEKFKVALTNALGATLADTVAIGSIRDNDG